MCKITPGQHMLFVLNQKISFIIQLLWHQLNQKLTFYVKWWQWYQKRSMYCFEISLYVPVALHKWYLYNLYRRPINLFRTIEVWYYVCLCALTGEILIALVCQIFASCVTSKARKFCCSSSCNMTVSSFQIQFICLLVICKGHTFQVMCHRYITVINIYIRENDLFFGKEISTSNVTLII